MNTAETGWPQALLLLGAGKMGAALLEGWLKNGMPGSAVTIVDPYVSSHVQSLSLEYGCSVNPKVQAGPQDIIVLAVKPQMLASVDLNNAVGKDTLVVSIMAGKTISNIQSQTPQVQAVIRAMPNTPASIGKGISGAFASPSVSKIQKELVQRLLGAVGNVEWLEKESDIDAVTAVSGSGPAYIFYMVECMAKAGEAVGLAPAIAMRLARATVEGAGYLLDFEKNQSASDLRVNVTSPNGTTAAALDVLMAEEGLEKLIIRTILAAKGRAGELSG